MRPYIKEQDGLGHRPHFRGVASVGHLRPGFAVNLVNQPLRHQRYFMVLARNHPAPLAPTFGNT